MRIRQRIDLTLDRRELLGVALAASVLPAASLLPTQPVAAAVSGPVLADDWSIDDQWSGYPRYSDPIGCGRCAVGPAPAIDPADAAFVPQ